MLGRESVATVGSAIPGQGYRVWRALRVERGGDKKYEVKKKINAAEFCPFVFVVSPRMIHANIMHHSAVWTSVDGGVHARGLPRMLAVNLNL